MRACKPLRVNALADGTPRPSGVPSYVGERFHRRNEYYTSTRSVARYALRDTCVLCVHCVRVVVKTVLAGQMIERHLCSELSIDSNLTCILENAGIGAEAC
jgi:hypothetical protein